MSLKGAGDGGYVCSIPAGYDDTADLTVHLKVWRNGPQGAVDRLFILANAARTRGLFLVTGGGSSTGGSASDIFAVCGPGTASWGSSTNHNGRGIAAAGPLSDTGFESIVVVVRGPGAADNTGLNGAQQIESIWRSGSFGTVGAAATSLATPSVGGRMNFFCREGTLANCFDGWLADVTVWQGWRPDAGAYDRIAAGDDPRTIGPPPLVYRSLRSQLAAEIGDTAMTAVGVAPGIDAAVNPGGASAAALAPESAVHAVASAGIALTVGASPSPARAVQQIRGTARLTVPSALNPANLALLQRCDPARLSGASLPPPSTRTRTVGAEPRAAHVALEPRSRGIALG